MHVGIHLQQNFIERCSLHRYQSSNKEVVFDETFAPIFVIFISKTFLPLALTYTIIYHLLLLEKSKIYFILSHRQVNLSSFSSFRYNSSQSYELTLKDNFNIGIFYMINDKVKIDTTILPADSHTFVQDMKHAAEKCQQGGCRPSQNLFFKHVPRLS